jgi:alkaline phosphatase
MPGMPMNRTFFAVLPLVMAAACAAPGSPRGPTSEAEIRNVIFMITDGGGVGMWTAAAYAEDELAVESMPVVGLLDTRSASHKVTDSAAGATAFATGERGPNRTISVGPASACPVPGSGDPAGTAWPPGCEPLESWFGIAEAKGKATGVVTTAAVVDASPAAFVASSPSRYRYDSIADQFADFGLEVMLGGGRRFFSADGREDGRDLLGEMCSAGSCVSSAAELAAYRADDRPLIGLFAPEDMDALEHRPVALPAMVEAALARLQRDPDGFVAVFETEATDNAAHGNVPLDRATADILEFDRAVGVALDFARRTPGTLVIVAADHETGGFSLAEVDRDFELTYATRGHTAALVPLFAEGPGAERFGGFRDNFEVGDLLLEIARGW